jgi:AmmeMemoRadiSam system protein B
MFYPASPEVLRREVEGLLADLKPGPLPGLHALIVPHAGYVYSGPVAAQAYALLRGHRYERVVLLGPSHRVAFRGLALPTVSRFHTPLGDVTLDVDCIERLSKLQAVERRDDAHALEHCLEVQLPFLQTVLDHFRLVPAVVGLATPKQVDDFLDVAVDARTLVIISTDLSHYHDYRSAKALDAATVSRIEARDATLEGEEACGAHPLNGFLRYAARRGWTVRSLDVRNSGDTSGDKGRVVGYASFAVV